MLITRHNYEEFFILYLDNELSAADRAQVDHFVQGHPDLAEELAMLQQTKLVPDTDVVFNKESLLLVPGHSSITPDNYEEWLLLYTDNELNPAQRVAVENFVTLHSAAKKELDLLQKTILQPETVVYFNKESLYRKEEKERRVIPIRWWRIAAAAILLFAVGTAAFFILNNKTTQPGDIARTGDKNPATNSGKPIIDSSPVKNRDNETATVNEKKDPLITAPIITNNTKAQTADLVKENKIPQEKKKVVVPEQLKDDQPAIASVIDNNPNNLPVRRYNNTNEMDNPIAYQAPDRTALTNQQENKPYSNVTSPSFTRLANETTAEETEQPEKKSKLRGLLRKVTRTFEKTTNIKATDENDRLLVAGLAIQL